MQYSELRASYSFWRVCEFNFRPLVGGDEEKLCVWILFYKALSGYTVPSFHKALLPPDLAQGPLNMCLVNVYWIELNKLFVKGCLRDEKQVTTFPIGFTLARTRLVKQVQQPQLLHITLCTTGVPQRLGLALIVYMSTSPTRLWALWRQAMSY